MQLPFVRSRYNSLPFAIDSAVASVGFFVLSASSGSSHVFFEKSCFASDGGVTERFSFWFLFVVVELFAFCAALVERANEATIMIAIPANSRNAIVKRLLRMIDQFLLLVLRA